MRTTLTLDPDVARLIDDAVHRERRPLEQVVNDALRRVLTGVDPTARSRHRAVPSDPAPDGLRPGLDLTGFNRLADDLEDEQTIERARRTS